MSVETQMHLMEPDTPVVLFRLDATIQGAGILYWTTTESTVPLEWKYAPDLVNIREHPFVPVNASGFEITAQGTLPRPRVEVSNLDTVFTSTVRQYGDLVGAILTRTRTFAQFLNNGSSPDPYAHLPVDIYRVEQKVQHDDEMIAWELTPYLDANGTVLPKRQVLRDVCMARTRRYVSGTSSADAVFDYTNATCPYVGTTYYKKDGTTTTNPAEEAYSRDVTNCCKKRFGENGELPTLAFPGVSRVRAQ